MQVALPDSLSRQATTLISDSLVGVGSWNPPVSGDIDICIRPDGSWYHEGRPLERDSLVKLFASILRKEGNDYFLVTPVEKWRIKVEDAPLLIHGSQVEMRNGQTCVIVKTTTGDGVVLSASHPLRMGFSLCIPTQKRPYVMVRDGLEALVHRNVYYQWQEFVVEEKGRYGIWSMGEFFPLD